MRRTVNEYADLAEDALHRGEISTAQAWAMLAQAAATAATDGVYHMVKQEAESQMLLIRCASNGEGCDLAHARIVDTMPS